jgi:ribosomal protein S18 acetylase RimI-like enzyme
MTEYDVRIAQESERDALISTLALAFTSDPCIRYAFPNPDTYLSAFRPLATALGGGALAAGAAYVAEGGAAVAFWLPPGVESDGPGIGAVIEKFVSPEKQEVLGEVVEGMGKYHPHEPHWYLAMLGADPMRQGQGLGSALLKTTLRRCDADGVIAYLESSNPNNVRLYERHGFEVMGLIQPGDFPPLYPMLRPAGG